MNQRVWRFGLTCALAVAFPLRAGQVQVQACSFSLDEALRHGDLVKTTTEEAVNVATIEERKILLHTFHLFPAFYFDIRQGDTNAYAEPPRANEDTDGTVVFGVDLIRREITRSGGTARNFSVPAIMGHEFGHLLQYKYGTTTIGPSVELQADFLAGWYLGNRSRSNGYHLTEQDLESALRSFYESGDYEFTDAQHHGTPEQRVAAVSAGYSHSALKFNEAYESSMEFIGDRGPLQKPSRALPFSPDEFESTLAKITAKRATGFAEFKGSPSPGMQFTWDATISLPSAKECSVVWSSEYQGEFDCTMAETFDVAIATTAWENLAKELKDEGWTATIEATPIKEHLKEANFKSTDGKELNLVLERKSLSTLAYRVDIEIPFDNY